MNVKQMAMAVGVDPKRLRAFLRSNAAKYSPPGAGGRYDLSRFSPDDVRVEYDTWRRATTSRIARSAPTDSEPYEEPASDDTLPLDASRDAVRAQTRARVDRLEQMLRAKGLHLSQMTEHPSWSSATTPRTSTRSTQRRLS